MIAMLDTSEDVDVCAAELGCPVEQLFTPLTRFSPQHLEAHFGIDNGCFKRFNEAAFLALLERERPRRDLCRFVCCPDVVASAIRTLEIFDIYRHKLQGWPVALVAQDGLENMAIPWHLVSAIFIGGSTQWKDGAHAAAIVRAAKILGKWVHVGRINTPGRFEKFEALGADSMDGSGLARFSWMRERIWKAQNNPTLFDQSENQDTSKEFFE
jgi:hypothetical protein